MKPQSNSFLRLLALGFLGLAIGRSGPSQAAQEAAWEALPDGSLGQVTEFRGVNETPIAAYLRKPTKGNGPFAAVVMIHGGGVSQQGTYALGRMNAAPTSNFLAQGWAVYSIDFRPKSPFQAIEWDDACRAVETLRKLPFIDGKRIAMIGGSHGGYNTARIASRCDLSCAIPCAAAAIDPIEVAKAQKGGEAVNQRAMDAIRRQAESYGLPLEELSTKATANYNTPLTEVANVRCPLLLVSGRNDPASPPSVMETYAKRLRDAGKQVELYLPDNGPHDFYFGNPPIPETEEAARRAVAFIAKHFGQSAKAAAPTPSKTESAPPRSAANSIDRLEKSWVEPDKTEPAGTKYKAFHSATINGEVSYLIYLPPDYDRAKDKRYPVLYWLHGTGGWQSRAAEVIKFLDPALRARKVPPMIVVLVNGLRGATMYCDTKDGQWPLESVLVKDLLPHIDATYRTIARRDARAVEGFSMGGFGAAHLGFKYPEVFGVVSILAPALLGPEVKIRWQEHFSFVFNNDLAAFQANDPFQLAAKNADKLRGRSIIRLVPHDEAGKWLIPRCDQLHAVLEKHNIPHEYDPRRDVTQHNYVLLYDALGEKALGFYTKAFAAFAGVVSDAKTQSESAQGVNSTALDRSEAEWEKLPDGSVGKGITYRTADGLNLAAYIRKPAGRGLFPVVVFLPGGGGQKDAASRLGRSTVHPISDFVAEGWAVCALTYRPPDPPAPNMDPREWDDVAKAIGTLRAFPFVDTKRVALAGHSHGARVVTMMLSRVDVRCGVVMAPVTLNLVEMVTLRDRGEKFSPAGLRMIDNMERIHKAKILEKREFFLRYSPFPEVKKARFPLLMMYAEDDGGGPVETAQNCVAELKKAGKEVEAYYPKQGGHQVFFGTPKVVPETEETAKRAVAFIAKHFDVPVKNSNPAAAPFTKAASASAESPHAPLNDDAKAGQLFRRLDKNNDGRIAGDEAASEPGKRFVRMFDKNGDGIITLAEIGGGGSASPSPQSDAGNAKSAATRVKSQRNESALTQPKTFHSAALKGPVSYTLYLPPSYARETQRRYPVVFWLHGGGGGPQDCWKFVEITDAAIKAGACPEMIVIGVDGRSRGGARPGSQYSDWKDGSLPMETVIIKELLPHIDQTCRTLGTREGRALQGFSMGGHGALHLAFRHPDLFGVVTALGPALIMPGDGGNRVQEVYQNGAYKGDEAYWRAHDPLTLAEKNAAVLRGRMFIRLITGEVEGNFTHRRTVELSEKLKALGIAHEFVRPGEIGHNYVKYYEALPDAPKFYAKAFPPSKGTDKP